MELAEVVSECAQCGVSKPKGAFSKRQWSMKVPQRVCKACVEKREESRALDLAVDIAAAKIADSVAAEDQTQNATKTKKKKKKKKAGKKKAKLEVVGFDTTDYFSSSANLDKWWEAYHKAFAAEHKWMEERGESTSHGMGVGAQVMMPLVFNDEAGSALKRHCFLARRGAAQEVEPCGYATVDEDPNPAGVCHLRMVLVAPENQRQGVGSALLQYVVAHFAKRHLGLKFARCHDYEGLYGKFGFEKLGNDQLYVYMALRRKL